MELLETPLPTLDEPRVVVPAPGEGPGNWAGAASAVLVDGVTYLAYRVRRPLPDGRGVATVVVRAADDIVDRGHLAPDTYAAVGEVFTDPGVLTEYLYLVAGYRMFASVSATRHNTAEDRDLPVWPPDGIGPEDTTP